MVLVTGADDVELVAAAPAVVLPADPPASLPEHEASTRASPVRDSRAWRSGDRGMAGERTGLSSPMGVKAQDARDVADGRAVERAGLRFSGGEWRDIRPRIGQRREVGLSGHWRVKPFDDGRKRVSRRNEREREKARKLNQAIVHDLSATGARLMVHADQSIVPNCVLQLELAGEWSNVRIAWIKPTPHKTAVWCGVMFLSPSPAFTAAVFGAMDAVAHR
ncbi:MAG: hypothetical protein JWM47_3280 [Acidimicrobiales bacterium]|nr:hypothetical protein [Acidimicrobiales bacterium]